MAKNKQKEMVLDLRPAIDFLGVKKVVDQVGLDRVIKEVGEQQVIQAIGIEKLLASMTSAQRRELVRRLRVESDK